MKIGILGTGHIGKSLCMRLSQAGHEVKVANSRGPETIDAELLSFGARAMTTEEALIDVDVVILSIPLNRIRGIAPLVARLPQDTVVIYTSNYYPFRDEKIEAIERGQVESLWVAEQLGRPIARHGTRSARTRWPGRQSLLERQIGLPSRWLRIARTIARSPCRWSMDTGLDAFDAGVLADSWRQQPGAPVYCTDLSYAQVGAALQAAERYRLPTRRDIGVAVMQERIGDGTTNPDAKWGVRLVRAINM